MPLSEQEQRLLDEMERNLYSSDADVVSAGGRARKPNLRAITIGALVAVAGVVGLVAGVMSQFILIGVFGFIVLFAGVLIALTPAKESVRVSVPKGKARPAAKAKSSGDFMGRMEERWDKRSEG